MTEHSIFPPSAMYRLITCPASWREEKSRLEQPQSEYAAHGVLLHGYVPRAYKESKDVVHELEDKLDRRWVLDCVEYLQVLVSTCNSIFELKFETRVNLAELGLDDVWGTADVILIDHYNKKVHVIDWKFGSGVPVYAEHNEQLMTYAAGVMCTNLPYTDFTLHLIQPPLDIEDTYETTAEELKAFAKGSIAPAIVEAQSVDPMYNPDEKACRFCLAKNDCKARYNQSLEDAKKVFALYRKLPHVTVEEMSEFLKMADKLKAAISDIQAHAFSVAMNGQPIPGFKLIHGKSSKEWLDEKVAARWFLENSPLEAGDLYTEPKFKSVAQMEKEDKLFKKDPNFLALYKINKGKLKLAPMSHKKPAITPVAQAKTAFADFIIEAESDKTSSGLV